MSEMERERLRERVASGEASGDELDRLAGMLAQAIRTRGPALVGAREQLLVELRELAETSERSACIDALLGALLDSQIRAFERRDGADAWGQLDRIRAWSLREGLPGEGGAVVEDRLAAALFNSHRGGELLGDEAMRRAALEELRTRAHGLPHAGASRAALAELLADAVADAWRRDELDEAERASAQLERLALTDELEVLRELGRALRELALGHVRPAAAVVEQLEQVLARGSSPGQAAGRDPTLARRLAEALVLEHADALRRDEPLAAEVVRERLRVLAGSFTPGTRAAVELIHELGKALHDAAVLGLGLGLGLAGVDQARPTAPDPDTDRAARALAELRVLAVQHEPDLELRSQLMSALAQIHRNAIERASADAGTDRVAAELLAEADALLAIDDAVDEQPRSARAQQRRRQLDLALRLDHLRMLLASHALAGDRGEWIHAEGLLCRARELVDQAHAPLELVEVFGQMLVNAHVDAGGPKAEDRAGDGAEDPAGDADPDAQRGAALLLELRELAQANPYSRALQLHLATALFNAHVEAGRSPQGAGPMQLAEGLLADLARLHRDHPGLLELRRRLVMALVNHHGDALEREDFARASATLEQVRELVRSPDADNHLRVQLAMALGNTLAHVDDPACSEDPARIVGELRVLAAREDASESLRALVLDELSDRFAPQQ